MRMVSELYGRHAGADIFVIGTGASMRVFPTSLLEGRITIGLNMAWKLCPVQYCVTIRPELNVPEFLGEAPRPEITWIIKPEKLTSHEQRQFVRREAERFYMFRSDGQPNPLPKDQPSIAGKVADWVRRPTGDFLYLWTSVSQTAANLAANLGAKNVFLVGCDNCALAGNHHAHQQHTFWKGEAPEVRYAQYEQGLAEVRAALHERGVSLVNLTPFVSLVNPVGDFERLCGELGVPQYIENQDISHLPAAQGGRRLSWSAWKAKARGAFLPS
jgi:hypothetical protein